MRSPYPHQLQKNGRLTLTMCLSVERGVTDGIMLSKRMNYISFTPDLMVENWVQLLLDARQKILVFGRFLANLMENRSCEHMSIAKIIFQKLRNVQGRKNCWFCGKAWKIVVKMENSSQLKILKKTLVLPLSFEPNLTILAFKVASQ